MRIDNSDVKVSFDFSPRHYYLVCSRDVQTGEKAWSLNDRIDRSEKGKDDDVGMPRIFLDEKEVESCKEAGFTWVDLNEKGDF